MSYYGHPLTCCDWECAAANGCGGEGGVECPTCGRWYCPVEEEGDEEGNCESCAREIAAESESEKEAHNG